MTISKRKARRGVLRWQRYCDHYMTVLDAVSTEGEMQAYNRLFDAEHYAERTALRRRHATLRKVLRKIRRSQQ